MRNYCDEPYGDLVLYVDKVLSAWTEVWSGSYRLRARFWFPGVAIWQIFVLCRFREGLVIPFGKVLYKPICICYNA